MPEPTSGQILSGGGNLLAGFGSLIEGEAAYEASKLEAKQLRANAVLAEEEAKVNESRQRRMSYKMLSSARAAVGASGITIEGSPMDVLEESAAQAELDALLIRHGGAVKAATYRNQARLTRHSGKVSRTLGFLNFGGSLLSAGGSFIGGG